MKHITKILVLFFILQSGDTFAATYYTRMNGDWGSVLTWSLTPGGPSAGVVPSPGDDMVINHYVNLSYHLTGPGSGGNGIRTSLTINTGATLNGGSTFDLEVKAGGYLYLCGTLIVRDLQFFNGSTVYVCPNAVIDVKRNFQNNNNSNTITINGTMTVGGSFTNGNGGVIGGTGNINITNGPVNNTGNMFGCNGTNPCTSYPCAVLSPCGVPLPVTWLAFSGKSNKQAIELNWVTASELNNDKFIIERSFDGELFHVINKVAGHGTTNQICNYNIVDNNPNSGLNYYRLQQVDFDGAVSYSKTIAIRVKKGSLIDFYPNPWREGAINAHISELENIEVRVVLLDKFGREVFNEIRRSELGRLQFEESDFRKFSPGTYVFKIHSNEEIFLGKFVIVK